MSLHRPRVWPRGTLLVLLAIWAALNTLVWSLTIPFGEGPDEVAHFEVVEFEAEHGRIPEVGVDDPGARVHVQGGGFPYAYHTYSAQPGLSYLISAATVNLLPDVDPRFASRLQGTVYAALLVLCIAWGIRHLFPGNRPVEILAATLAAGWPQVSFVFSYTNNDGYTLLATSALIAYWSRGVDLEWKGGASAAAGVLSGLVLLGKPNGLPVVAATMLLIALTGGRGRRTVVERIRQLGVWGGVTAVVAGWWYAIAYTRYGLDIFADGRAGGIAASLGALRVSGRSMGLGFFETAVHVSERVPHSWLETTAQSALGMFSAMTKPLPGGIYVFVGGMVLLSIVGWTVGGEPRLRREKRVPAAFMLLMILIVALLSLWRSYDNDYQPQGRYLFSAFFGFVSFFAAGLVRLISRLPQRNVLLFSIGSAFILINLGALIVTLVPAYSESAREWFSRSPAVIALWILWSALTVPAIWWYGFHLDKHGQPPP